MIQNLLIKDLSKTSLILGRFRGLYLSTAIMGTKLSLLWVPGVELRVFFSYLALLA